LDADINKDGSLNREEIQLLIENTELGLPLDIDSILQECDADKNGTIEYSEFLTACINWRTALSLEKLEAVFDSFDQDGNGTIDLNEIKALFDDASDSQVINLVNEADKNGD